jgi:hypothetical protein
MIATHHFHRSGCRDAACPFDAFGAKLASFRRDPNRGKWVRFVAGLVGWAPPTIRSKNRGKLDGGRCPHYKTFFPATAFFRIIKPFD